MGAGECRCSEPEQKAIVASRASTSLDEELELLAAEPIFEDDPEPVSPARKNRRAKSLGFKTGTVGDHKVPNVGGSSVKAFLQRNMLERILAATGEDLGRTFSLDPSTVKATGSRHAGGFACAISDPTSEDCPLVFVSDVFEDQTGYTSDFACGRNCRFLQPTSKTMNDAFNGEERRLMRDFCTTSKPVGTTCINLLLNEQIDGQRFWNLLRMQYVEVEETLYIFAVQTVLNAFMPKLLQKKVRTGHLDKEEQIVEALKPFLEKLENMRKELRGMIGAPIMECKGYFTCALNYMQLLPILNSVKLELQEGVPALQKKQESQAEESQIETIVVGAHLICIEVIVYPTNKITVGSKGIVTAINSFGSCVDWTEGFVGSKTLLPRDYGKVKRVNGMK